MTDYVVCHRKRNSPRLSVRICKEKCPFKEECKEYLSCLKMSLQQTQRITAREDNPVVLTIP
jgi:hypothetical protein